MMKNTEAAVFAGVKKLFEQDYSGHDFSHTDRVYKTALRIAEQYDCDRETVALAALLHDADDPKVFSTRDYSNARAMLAEAGVDPERARQVIDIISKISFKGTGREVPETIEGKIVQDADRLDAIGAVGIARAFAYGGSHQRQMYDPETAPNFHMDETAYRSQRGTTVNHFYEKLLRLKDLMNTGYAKALAENRTKVMEAFLTEFLEEWNGIK